ncbi:MAG: class I SAM-dependent methyltransferase [Proteobacteria bacterium]|nr:class I SAM-dependent methyltransferase [Pseudomonadota bacterium]
MRKSALGLDEELYDYLVKVSLREAEVLRRLREETAAMPLSIMQIAPEQGQFMALLVELMGAVRCIEVGVFTGYSSLAVALALPPEGRIVACDVSEEFTSVARRYWRQAGVDHKIDLRLAPALETLDGLLAEGEAGAFDFAFIDAEKSEYADYYDRLLTLLRPGGLILIDNVLWSGRVADPHADSDETVAIRAFNEKLLTDERVSLSMLPVADGLTLARKR